MTTLGDLAARLIPGQRIELERLDDGRVEVTTSGPYLPRANATKILAPIDRELGPAVELVVDQALGSSAELIKGSTPDEIAFARRYALESDRRLGVAAREVVESMRGFPGREA